MMENTQFQVEDLTIETWDDEKVKYPNSKSSEGKPTVALEY